MKKRLLITSLLLTLCSCGGETPNSNSNSITSSYSSSSSLVPSSSSSQSSTSSNTSNTNEREAVKVLNRELECVLNDDSTGYIISKYKGQYDKYIIIPENFYGLYSTTKTINGVEYDVYSGESKFADGVLELPIVGILDSAFVSAGGVVDIHIPDTCKFIGDSAFSSCRTTENYYVSDNHEVYKSVDGVLYTKDGESLFAYPLARRSKYEVVDGTKNILGGAFKTAYVSEVVLPESVENIEPYAFYMSNITKVNIPSKIKTIKEYTFNTCNSLKEVVFSEGLETIGEYAFQHCQLLSTFTFPSTLRELKTSAFEQILSIKHLVLNEGLETIGDFAFAYNEYTESITFPSTLKTIGKYAFMQNYRMKELNLVEGIEELQEGSFFYNTALKKVIIPASLKIIGFKSFSTADYGVEEYIVSEQSDNFVVVDGIVFTKDMKELVISPVINDFENGKYVVPEGVEKIGDHAFYNNQSLRSIKLPSTLKFIGRAPFYITRLSTIEYNGTTSEFALIESEDEIFNSSDSSETLAVKWYQTNENGAAVSIVTCTDGKYTLIQA